MITILVPVLRRPHRAQPLVDSIAAATPEPHTVLFICSPGDRTEIAAARATTADVIVTPVAWARGDYPRKINFGYEQTDTPLLFLAADDLHFHPGWLPAATARLTDGIGVVGTNDLANLRTMRGEHSTHSLVTRDYIDRYGTIDQPGAVLHEGYWHEFVDDEFCATAKARHAYAHASDSVVEHLHPMVGKAPLDNLYRQQGRRMRVGRALYQRRCQLWA